MVSIEMENRCVGTGELFLDTMCMRLCLEWEGVAWWLGVGNKVGQGAGSGGLGARGRELRVRARS